MVSWVTGIVWCCVSVVLCGVVCHWYCVVVLCGGTVWCCVSVVLCGGIVWCCVLCGVVCCAVLCVVWCCVLYGVVCCAVLCVVRCCVSALCHEDNAGRPVLFQSVIHVLLLLCVIFTVSCVVVVVCYLYCVMCCGGEKAPDHIQKQTL